MMNVERPESSLHSELHESSSSDEDVEMARLKEEMNDEETEGLILGRTSKRGSGYNDNIPGALRVDDFGWTWREGS